MKNIVKYLEESKEIEQKALDMLNIEVDNIITNNITDISIIENTLDTLMNFLLVDTSVVFNKLNQYYEKCLYNSRLFH